MWQSLNEKFLRKLLDDRLMPIIENIRT